MSLKPNTQHTLAPEVRRRIIRWISRAALGVVGYGLVLFLSAGRLAWLWGWLFLLVLTALMAAHPLILVPSNPELLAERDKGTLDEGVKSWDKVLTTLAGGLMILSWVIAGLDVRFGWSGPLPVALHLSGAILNILGHALFMGAMAVNPFFSEGVRIQTERNHQVATGGPYRYVRHPGYVGAILAQLATPLFLGSWWSALASLALALVFLLRTWLEDRTLQRELPGYIEYCVRVQYRLLPGIW